MLVLLKCVSSPRLFPLQEPGVNSEAAPLTKEEIEVKKTNKQKNSVRYQKLLHSHILTEALPFSSSVFSEAPLQRIIFSSPTCSCWTSTESSCPMRKRGKSRDPQTGKRGFETSTREWWIIFFSFTERNPTKAMNNLATI